MMSSINELNCQFEVPERQQLHACTAEFGTICIFGIMQQSEQEEGAFSVSMGYCVGITWSVSLDLSTILFPTGTEHKKAETDTIMKQEQKDGCNA